MLASVVLASALAMAPPRGAAALPLAAWNAQGDWREAGGVMETPTGNDWKLNLLTKESFADVELNVEFRVPKGGNSGVYLMGRYEIQILDSFGVPDAELKSHMCGAIYERWENDKGFEGRPPLTNAAKPAGEWQQFNIKFRAPRFKDGRKVEDAFFVEVKLNGKVVQRRQKVTGPTRASWFNDEQAAGPVMLQGDHGPIAFRNIWIKKVNLDRVRP